METTYELWQRRPVTDPTLDTPRWGPYVKAYTGTVDLDPAHPNRALDTLFHTFNVAHPADFTGHSMSVCDVVVFPETETTFEVMAMGFEPASHPSTRPETTDVYFFHPRGAA